ncbi:MAG TPA: tetratricopeptide repeat protein [Bryobacteraceae bacterium]|nr:tetratricopeptide repeat protein [Bryobacteraceae bacterium]
MQFVSLSFALAAAFLCGPRLSMAQGAGDEIQRRFLAARQAQEQGRLDAAEREYLEVLRLDPTIAEAHASLGMLYHEQSALDRSAREFEKALALKPGLPGANLFLGIDLAKLGRAARAVVPLQKAVAAEPDNKHAHSWLAGALWEAGRHSEALRALRSAAHRFRDDPDILFLLGEAYGKAARSDLESVIGTSTGAPIYHIAFGDIYREQQNWQRAARHYRRALEKDPRCAGAHLGLGELLFAQGKLDEAAGEFHEEMKGNAAPAAAQSRLAEIALIGQQPVEALRLLAAAIRMSPEQAEAALLAERASTDPEPYRTALPALEAAASGPARSLALAAAYLRLGQTDRSEQARKQFEASGRGAPAATAYGRARQKFERREFESAETELNALLASGAKSPEACYLRARTYQQLSLAVTQRMLALAPDSYRSHQLLAQSYEQRELDGKALEEYRIVVSLRPALPGVHYTMGHLLWRSGDPDRALEELARELALDPGHAEANAETGLILVARHEQEKAIPYLQRALERKPDLPLAHQQLGKALYQRRDFAGAARELRLVLAQDPDGSNHYLLGQVERELGHAGESKAALETARRIKAERLAGARIDAAGEERP